MITVSNLAIQFGKKPLFQDVNLKFTPGLLLIAGGIWFLRDRIFFLTPEMFKNFYWPVVIVVTGLGFILSSFLKRKF